MSGTSLFIVAKNGHLFRVPDSEKGARKNFFTDLPEAIEMAKQHAERTKQPVFLVPCVSPE